MRHTLILNHFRAAENSARRRIYLRRKLHLGPITLGFITLILICVLSLFYLTSTDGIATKGYELKDLEGKVKSLKDQNEQLKLERAQLESIKNLEENVKQFNMMRINQVSFTTPWTGEVVKAK